MTLLSSPHHSSDGPRTRLLQLLDLLEGKRNVLVATHLHPDGDALGSALALSMVLEKLGYPNEVLCQDHVPDYLQFLPGSSRVRAIPEGTRHDMAAVVDLEALHRLGSVRPFVEACPVMAVIDHHVPHESPGDLRIVDVTSPATCAILTEMFETRPDLVDPDVATCLLTGLVTDTGSFRYSNTNSQALHLAAFLLERGADLAEVTEQVYFRKHEAAVRLQAESVLRMKLACEGRLVWSTLPWSLFDKCGAHEEHTEGVVNELLSVRTAEVAALLREAPNGRVRVSLRSRKTIDVSQVAQELGGGGHKQAAGVSFDCGMEQAEEILVRRLKQCLGSCS